MGAEAEILIWWILFGGTHVGGSSVPARSFLIARLGLRGFKGLYSLVAFATLIPLCFVYAHNKHAGALLFVPPAAFRQLAEALMLLALVFLAQAYASPNPMTTGAEMEGKFTSSARGIHRVTRHPLNFAFALFGVAHMLVNPHAGDWIFFGGFVVYAIVSALHQDRRTRAMGPDAVRKFQDETSLVPFAAILSGRQRFAAGELSVAGGLVSIGLFVLLRVYHGKLFGGFAG